MADLDTNNLNDLADENDQLRRGLGLYEREIDVLRAENERLRALEAIVREHIDHQELAWHLRQWLAPIDQQQDDRDTALLGMNIPEPESWQI